MGKGGGQTDSVVANNIDQKNETDDSIFNRLQNLHLAAAIFMGIQAIMYGAITGNTTASTTPTVSFQGSGNEDCDNLSCDIKIRGLGDWDALWLMPFFVALASADHWICWIYSKVYPESTKEWIFVIKSNPFRWMEYSISASSMVLAITILCRITDIHIWFLVFTSTAVGMLCGQALELLPAAGSSEENDWPMPIKAKYLRELIYSIGTLCIFLPWMVLLCYFFYACENTTDMPDFVYGAFLGTLVFFMCFGINSLNCQILGLYPWHTSELIYIVLSFTAKTFLAADVFGGLKAAEDR